ncbi:TadE/TadG family type IV pilus assembly protein [Microbaculum sp. FT89]|uniref:TadE/TadG family type IV pilus assembly protein n=1 Tax=Microbaculum sp. FT89 TaxID=3447298 RepID=UPI003F531F51
MTPCKRLRWKGLGRDERGTSAVEFALILPVLILIYAGGVELSHAITVDRKLTTAGGSVGDLVAQGNIINQVEMDNIFSAAQAIMEPYSSATLKVVVTSVDITSKGDKVLGSCSYHASARAKGSIMSVPEGVRVEGTTLVITEVQYEYIPTIGQILTESITLNDTFYMRPRQGEAVKLPC